jgi:hypothetical protein
MKVRCCDDSPSLIDERLVREQWTMSNVPVFVGPLGVVQRVGIEASGGGRPTRASSRSSNWAGTCRWAARRKSASCGRQLVDHRRRLVDRARAIKPRVGAVLREQQVRIRRPLP